MAKIAVAPLVGAWIEILIIYTQKVPKSVAPLVGAWIEIGLASTGVNQIYVAPLVGAWIEIVGVSVMLHIHPCRSPRGSVD